MLTYQEAVSDEDKYMWLKAIQEEKFSLKKNEVFEFVQETNVKGKQNLLSMSENLDDNKPKESGKLPYREAVGSLLYLSNGTRPDITSAVNMASRKTTNLTIEDVQNDNITVIDAYSDAMRTMPVTHLEEARQDT
ncbi:hypothetical protein PR048_026647 [Dryococelus australis]|uniref:PH domain-containing protein n=1 Tax=Dryococelus australis TaxID=614101 RepID=A0ABQ9GLX4_9NEOP|nr:hypothetical protein PR048_026647 [Dryococelus australis]